MPRQTPTEPDLLGALVNNTSSTPGFGATPIMQEGSLPLEQQTAKTGSTTHHKRRPTPTRAPLGSHQDPTKMVPFWSASPKACILKPSEGFSESTLWHACQSKPFGGLKGCGTIHPCCHCGQTKPSETFRWFVLSQHCGHGCQSKPFGCLKGCGPVHPCCHRGQTKASKLSEGLC